MTLTAGIRVLASRLLEQQHELPLLEHDRLPMKRKRKTAACQHTDKRQKTDSPASHPSQPLLKRYYPQVVTLRQYLASRLSKKARRRLQQYGRDPTSGTQVDSEVIHLLDAALVGSFKPVHLDASSFIEEDITLFTQQLTASDTTVSLTPGEFKQNEVGYATSMLITVLWVCLRGSVN